MNVSKSCFLAYPKVSPQRMLIVGKLMGFAHKSFPIKYLDCPMFVGRKLKEIFLDIIVSAAARIQQWSARWLSFEVWILLIKSILSSLSIYLLSDLDPPRGVIHQIEKLFTSFL